MLTASKRLNGLCKWVDSVVLRVPASPAPSGSVGTDVPAAVRGLVEAAGGFLDFERIRAMTVVPERAAVPPERAAVLDRATAVAVAAVAPHLAELEITGMEVTPDALGGLRGLAGLCDLTVSGQRDLEVFSCLREVESLRALHIRAGRPISFEDRKNQRVEGPWLAGLTQLESLVFEQSAIRYPPPIFASHTIAIPDNLLCLKNLVSIDLQTLPIKRACFVSLVSGLRDTLQDATFSQILDDATEDGGGIHGPPSSLTTLTLSTLGDVGLFLHPLFAGLKRLAVTSYLDFTDRHFRYDADEPGDDGEGDGSGSGSEGIDSGTDSDGEDYGTEEDDEEGSEDESEDDEPQPQIQIAAHTAVDAAVSLLLRKTALVGHILAPTATADPFFIINVWPRTPEAWAALRAHVGHRVRRLMIRRLPLDDGGIVTHLASTFQFVHEIACSQCEVTKEGIDALLQHLPKLTSIFYRGETFRKSLIKRADVDSFLVGLPQVRTSLKLLEKV